MLRAISDQLALVLERDRLLRTATEAEVYRQGEQMRKSLLAAVSHDLRSPLAAIKASVTDLLSEEVSRSDGERREVLETIDKESDRLNVLIANLLDMGRIEAGVLKARIQVVNVNEAVTACADHLTSRWPSVDVRTSVDESAALVRADPVFLDRVLFNLLDNGAKTGWRAGRPGVEVEVRPNGGRTTVRVIDHGEGRPGLGARAAVLPVLRARRAGEASGARAWAGHRQGLPLAHGRGDLGGGHARRWCDVRVLPAAVVGGCVKAA